jgi:hypothetical protein
MSNRRDMVVKEMIKEDNWEKRTPKGKGNTES